jgi:hypothetical protein
MQDMNIEHPTSSAELKLELERAISELDASLLDSLSRSNQTNLENISRLTGNIQDLRRIEFDEEFSRKYYEIISDGIINGFDHLNDPTLFYQIDYWKFKDNNFARLALKVRNIRKKRILKYTCLLISYIILNLYLISIHL